MRTSGRKSESPRVVKIGSVVVKVDRVNYPANASGLDYSVSHVAATGRQFTDESAALEEARLMAQQVATGRIETTDMTRSDRDDLPAAREICGSVPILSTLEGWRRARDLTQGHLIMVFFVLGFGTALDDLVDVRRDEVGLQLDEEHLPKRVRGRMELSPVLQAMGVLPEIGLGAIRFSLGRATTADEIDAVADRLRKVGAAKLLSPSVSPATRESPLHGATRPGPE